MAGILILAGLLVALYPIYHGFFVDWKMRASSEAFRKEHQPLSSAIDQESQTDDANGWKEAEREDGDGESEGISSDGISLNGNTSGGASSGKTGSGDEISVKEQSGKDFHEGESSDGYDPEKDSSDGNLPQTDPPQGGRQEMLDDLLSQVQRYNETLYQSGQKDMIDAASLESDLVDIKKEDSVTLQTGIGTIRIPVMKIELPIFQGATEANFLKGAAVCSQTSFPIGGENTNSVIAAHRGWKGGRYFRDIELLREGDTVEITNFWDTLTYRVTEIRLVLPTDVDAIKIIPGRDMITLMTCHPYIGHQYRYLVYCERDLKTESTLPMEQGPARQIPGGPDESSSAAETPVYDKELTPDGMNNNDSQNTNNSIPFRSSGPEILMDITFPILLTAAIAVFYLAILRLRKR